MLWSIVAGLLVLSAAAVAALLALRGSRHSPTPPVPAAGEQATEGTSAAEQSCCLALPEEHSRAGPEAIAAFAAEVSAASGPVEGVGIEASMAAEASPDEHIDLPQCGQAHAAAPEEVSFAPQHQAHLLPAPDGADGGPVPAPSPDRPSEEARRVSVTAGRGRVVHARRHVHPIRRVGAPRVGWRQSSRRRAQGPRTRRRPLAEVICVLSQAAWRFEVEFDTAVGSPQDYVLEVDGATVDVGQGTHPLPELAAPVVILPKHGIVGGNGSREVTEESAKAVTVWPGQKGGPPFAFRIAARGDRGRYIPKPTAGPHLFVVPATWMARQQSVGELRPQSVDCSEDYHAYLVVLQPGEPIDFVTTDRVVATVRGRKAAVSLRGSVVPDGAPELGQLFAPSPPDLVADRPEAWDDIRLVVLGQEGYGSERHVAFTPAPGQRTQSLPRRLFETSEAGWFFARLYSSEDVLLDSLPFRFAGGVTICKRLEFDPAFPGPEGHPAAEIDLALESGWSVRPYEDSHADPERVQALACSVKQIDEGRFRLILASSARADVTRWTVRSPGGGSVDVSVSLPRVRWTVTKDSESSEWQDTPLLGSREWFGALSEVSLLISVPKGRGVRVGFTRGTSREVRCSSGIANVPLRSFSEAQELAAPASARFCIWASDRPVPCISLPPRAMICSQCRATLWSPDEMAAHLESHLEHFFGGLGYGRASGAEMPLPRAIYQCTKDCTLFPDPRERCFAYGPGKRPRPCSRSDVHGGGVQSGSQVCDTKKSFDACPKEGECDLCRGGCVGSHFRTIVAVQEIRRAMRTKREIEAVQCRLCPPGSDLLWGASVRDRVEHLLEHHASRLWSVGEECRDGQS